MKVKEGRDLHFEGSAHVDCDRLPPTAPAG
jgi:hypothetical protein